MNEFFKWLSNNPIATTALIMSFSTLIASVTVIYFVAFFQGREISFWPPKIGKKPIAEANKTKNSLEMTSDKIASAHLTPDKNRNLQPESKINYINVELVILRRSDENKFVDSVHQENRVDVNVPVVKLIEAITSTFEISNDSYELYFRVPSNVTLSELQVKDKTSLLLKPKPPPVKFLRYER